MKKLFIKVAAAVVGLFIKKNPRVAHIQSLAEQVEDITKAQDASEK